MEDPAIAKAHPYVAAFVGVVVPDTEEFRSESVSPAGNLSQLNLLRSLIAAGVNFTKIYSFLPVPSFPGAKKLFVRGRTVKLFNGCEARLLPFFNVNPWKQIHWGLSVFCCLLWWGLHNLRQSKIIYTYNLSRPPGIFAYAAARLTGSRMVASLYDIGVPGLTDPDDLWQRLTFRAAKWLVPRLDGRVVISKRIVQDFAPDKGFLHVDGGVSDELIQSCGVLHARHADSEFVLAFAGRLTEYNGVRLILQAFAQLGDPSYRLYIAGAGPLQDDVLKAAQTDRRIVYKGLLEQRQVSEMYHQSDLLLNVRLTSPQYEVAYAFPSKLIEYLLTGKCVLTTSFAHVESEYGSYCFLLKEETPEALAKRIEAVRKMDVQERQQFGAQAREYVVRNKTWKAQGLRISNYLEEILLSDEDKS